MYDQLLLKTIIWLNAILNNWYGQPDYVIVNFF